MASSRVAPEFTAATELGVVPNRGLQFAEPQGVAGSRVGAGADFRRTLSTVTASSAAARSFRSVESVSASGSPHSVDNEVPIRFRTLSIHVTEDQLPPAPEGPLVADLRQTDHHLISVPEVYARYSTHPELGLEKPALERKIRENGRKDANKITPPKTNYALKIATYVFSGFNALMWLAFILTLLSYQPLGQPNPQAFNLGVACLILVVITTSSFFYAIVDFQASRVMSSIKSLIATSALVTREGHEIEIHSAELVVGDLVHLSLGNRVPADLRLVSCSPDLKFDRSLLTGESDPVRATVDATDKNPLETRNVALSSTFVVQGSGTGVVVAIGDKTVMGSIASLSSGQKNSMTPIQRELWRFTMIISGLAVGLFTLAILFWGVYIRPTYPDYLNASGAIINAIGVLTAFVPQGLPLCVALAMTIIARRMAARKILVKNLATTETLGCMSVLCSDKTGTLTLGRMTAVEAGFLDTTIDLEHLASLASAANLPALDSMHLCASLCCAASFDPSTIHLPIAERGIRGDGTDGAVLKFAESLGSIDAIREDHDKLFELPFNSKNKWMMTIWAERGPAEPVMFVKGAPDVLFASCTTVLKSDGTSVPLDADAKARISALQESWSNQGRRVLALCSKSLVDVDLPYDRPADMEKAAGGVMKGLTLVGLLGLVDPPRPDIKTSIATMREAGVRVFMVTGDYRLTAVSIARQVGIVTSERIDSLEMLQANTELIENFKGRKKPMVKPDNLLETRALVVDGSQLGSMSEEDWDTAIGGYTEIVFARTTPEQKLRIVEEVKRRGDNVVGVTGDGVNDSPALKAADVGVAMGAGSDVAKEAAALVLLNNDFASIPVAIENGRLLFDNLKKVLCYIMPAGTYTEFSAIFLNAFLGQPLALSGYQQIIICVTNDVVMSLSLMFEKPESDLMKRPPRNARTDRLTDWRYFIQVYGFIGLLMIPFANYMFWRYMQQTAGIGISQLVFAFGNWTDGYLGYTQDELNAFQSAGQTCFYVALCMFQFGNVFVVRNRRVSSWMSNPFKGPRQNRLIFAGMIASVLIVIINVYGPGIQTLFGAAVIPAEYWFMPLGYAAFLLFADEMRKFVVRNYPNSFVAKCAW